MSTERYHCEPLCPVYMILRERAENASRDIASDIESRWLRKRQEDLIKIESQMSRMAIGCAGPFVSRSIDEDEQVFYEYFSCRSPEFHVNTDGRLTSEVIAIRRTIIE